MGRDLLCAWLPILPPPEAIIATNADQDPIRSIGTADIDNILYLVMDWFTGDEVPQCVGNVLFNNHMLQWLLLPVERYGDAGLEAYIQYFRGGEGRGPEEDHMVAMEKILAELGYRFENVDTRGAEAVMRKHRINSQDVKNLNAAYKAASLPTGYETLNTWGLEELIMADAAKSAGESDDPYPLPLTIDQPQAEQILELQDDTMELVKQREYPDFEKEELKSLIWKLADPKIQEGLSSAVSRYSDLLKENEQAEFQEHWGEQHPGQDASSGASRYHLPSHLWGGQSGSGTLSRSTLGHALSVQQANDISGWTHQPPPSAVYPSGHRRQYYGHYNTNEDDGGEPSGGYYEASLPEESFLSGADFCEDEYEHGGYYNTGHGEGGSSRQRYSWQ